VITVRLIGRYGVATSAGDVFPGGPPVTLPDHEARGLIARGRAVVVVEEVATSATPAPAPDPVVPAVRHRDPKPPRRR
jgi:hypothetical protein